MHLKKKPIWLKLDKITIYLLLILFVNISYAQQEKTKYTGFKPAGGFGGTFADFSVNKLGNSLAFGGGGSFLFKNGIFLGAFGQGSTTLVVRKSKLNGYEHFDLKTRFTGFWVGYLQRFEKTPKFNLSYYGKVGFGRVSLDNPIDKSSIYENAKLFSLHVEPILQVTSFLQIGIGVFYDIYAGKDFKGYKSSDFNALGATFSLRFGSAKYY